MALMDIVSWLQDLPWTFTWLHASILAGVLLLYLIGLGIYRLHLSPISHIPGPRLAARTWAYEFYYDIVRGGQYSSKIIRKRHKWRFSTEQFDYDQSATATIDHDHHRLRRLAVAPFFSRQSVGRLQPVIEERVDALFDRLRRAKGVVDLMYPFSAFTNGEFSPIPFQMQKTQKY
jgi:hypothetical protein